MTREPPTYITESVLCWGCAHFSPFTIRHSFNYKTDKLASNVDLTYRLPCIVHPPALMPGQEGLSIFPSVYFTFWGGFLFVLFFYMQLVIHLEFMLAPGGELQSTYLADTNLFPHCLVMPPAPASSTCQAAPCGTRSPVPRVWEHGRAAAAATVRDSWHTARPAGPAHRSPHTPALTLCPLAEAHVHTHGIH